MSTFSNYFSKIYSDNLWGCGSGGGSLPINTEVYREFLSHFLDDNKKSIKEIIDFGCGDWQSSKFINWSGFNYTGIDCVDFLIKKNNDEYSKNGIKFEYLENISDFFDRKSDLLIIKDVLQHWTCDEIVEFLDKIVKNHKFIIITNSSSQKEDWQDEPFRSRPLTSNLYPLKKYSLEVLLVYKCVDNPNDIKEISIIKN